VFLRSCAKLLAPGGVMIVATINRTSKAFVLAIVGAEHVLRWLPVGTHQYEKLVKPEEARAPLAAEGLDVEGPFGVSYNPLADAWSLSDDANVNYMLTATRP
jgi:2-polyprenyl-6-hydroxyphenyl methylase/3-demethylubiquinone-9 3-methyltransferase